MNKKHIWLISSVAIFVIVILIWLITGSNNRLDLVESGQADRNGIDQSAGEMPEYNFKEAADHIGERAIVSGKVFRVMTTKSGVTFLDFCPSYGKCAFSAVIFASDLKNFENVKQYERDVKISGVIKSYKGQAEMIINGPDQIE